MHQPSIFGTIAFLPNARQLETGEFNSDELATKLTEIVDNESQRNEILSSTRGTAVLVIECLDKVIFSDAPRTKDVQARTRLFAMMSRLSRRHHYLPRSYWVDPASISLPNMPFTTGTYAQVYHGKWDGQSVAAKVMRTSNQENPLKLKRRFCKEAILWRHVSCPYVLKFHGVFYHNELPAMITPWVPHGNIMNYLEKHHDANRFPLLLCAVKGIKYLHYCNIPHGDIKPQNILISSSVPPRAMLADLAFTRIATSLIETLGDEQGTAPFMAPEFFLPAKFGLERGVSSKEADIYALGMTMYQVLAGRSPFFPKRKTEVVLAVLSGERPGKPENAEEMGITELVWELLEGCWREDMKMRLEISEILTRLCEITGEGMMTIDDVIGTAGLPSVATDNTPATSYGNSLDQKEILEAKRTDRTENDNWPVTGTSQLGKEGNLPANKSGANATHTKNSISPAGVCLNTAEARTKTKRVWTGIKRVIVFAVKRFRV